MSANDLLFLIIMGIYYLWPLWLVLFIAWLNDPVKW